MEGGAEEVSQSAGREGAGGGEVDASLYYPEPADEGEGAIQRGSRVSSFWMKSQKENAGWFSKLIRLGRKKKSSWTSFGKHDSSGDLSSTGAERDALPQAVSTRTQDPWITLHERVAARNLKKSADTLVHDLFTPNKARKAREMKKRSETTWNTFRTVKRFSDMSWCGQWTFAKKNFANLDMDKDNRRSRGPRRRGKQLSSVAPPFLFAASEEEEWGGWGDNSYDAGGYDYDAGYDEDWGANDQEIVQEKEQAEPQELPVSDELETLLLAKEKNDFRRIYEIEYDVRLTGCEYPTDVDFLGLEFSLEVVTTTTADKDKSDEERSEQPDSPDDERGATGSASGSASSASLVASLTAPQSSTDEGGAAHGTDHHHTAEPAPPLLQFRATVVANRNVDPDDVHKGAAAITTAEAGQGGSAGGGGGFTGSPLPCSWLPLRGIHPSDQLLLLNGKTLRETIFSSKLAGGFVETDTEQAQLHAFQHVLKEELKTRPVLLKFGRRLGGGSGAGGPSAAEIKKALDEEILDLFRNEALEDQVQIRGELLRADAKLESHLAEGFDLLYCFPDQVVGVPKRVSPWSLERLFLALDEVGVDDVGGAATVVMEGDDGLGSPDWSRFSLGNLLQSGDPKLSPEGEMVMDAAPSPAVVTIPPTTLIPEEPPWSPMGKGRAGAAALDESIDEDEDVMIEDASTTQPADLSPAPGPPTDDQDPRRNYLPLDENMRTQIKESLVDMLSAGFVHGHASAAAHAKLVFGSTARVDPLCDVEVSSLDFPTPSPTPTPELTPSPSEEEPQPSPEELEIQRLTELMQDLEADLGLAKQEAEEAKQVGEFLCGRGSSTRDSSCMTIATNLLSLPSRSATTITRSRLSPRTRPRNSASAWRS